MPLSQRTRVSSNAFTLIEILVALVIVTIIVAVTLMQFGDFGRSRKERLSMMQFKQHIEAARQEAILESDLIGLRILHHGYVFYQYWVDPTTHQGSWQPLSDKLLSRANAFANAHVRSNMPIGNLKPTQATNQPSSTPKPTIFFYPNGTVTPFTITLTFDRQRHYHLDVNQSGEVTLEN